MVDALKIEAVDRVFPDTFNVHATTDKSRWQDLYNFQTTTTAQIADLQGKVLDNTQQLAIQNNVSFTVSNTLGGSISVITQTTDTLFTTITINGTQVYSSQGIEVGLSLTKSYEVANADTVVVSNAVDASFIPFADSGNSYATTSYVDSAIASVHIEGALIFQGTVPTVADLDNISNPETGDYYQVLDNGQFYLFNGIDFVEATGLTDLSDYYTKSEVDTKLSTSTASVEEAPADSQFYSRYNKTWSHQPYTNFQSHCQTDGFRWQDSYNTSLDMYTGIAETQGLMLDSTAIDLWLNNTSGNTYTVTSEYGGLLTATCRYVVGSYAQIFVNGKSVYSANGLAQNVTVMKYIRVKQGDTVYHDDAFALTFTAFIADPNSYMQGIFNQLDTQSNQIANLSQQILNIKASIQNQIPDTANMVNIPNTTYNVTSTLGGQLVGKGSTTLGLLGIKVASTGTVTVNGTNVYDNTSLLGVGTVETLTTDVYDGDVIVSDGMASLTFTPYIAV